MNYQEAVDYIHSLLKFGIKPGLERISALLNALSNPQNDLKYIHIAGTNGKGSTSTMISEILSCEGKKVGLFTSPYVFDFCERIKVNGENIPQNELAKTVATVKNAVNSILKDGIEPTEFEVITACAILYFKETKCDIAVLEVGLGGRFDSTNIIPPPIASIITSISLDHTQILGDTVEQIAMEKCGIIKNSSKIITTSRQDEKALKIIKETANNKECDLYIGKVQDAEILNENIFGTDFLFDGLKIHLPLVGSHQVENAVGVITCIKAIGGISDKSIVCGIEKTKIPARMEIIEKSPTVLIDGGHNEECSVALSDMLKRFVRSKITVVIGMMADKDCEHYLKNVLPLCDAVILTNPSNPRAISPNELEKIAKKYCDNITIEENPKKAFKMAKDITKKEDMVLVCGSFYLLSDIF
ncbi:MAG: folylpolyglutamate synthase/dihydrofolate synthase family protein [Oscillospiraceae bacterium]